MTDRSRGTELYGPCFELACQELSKRLGLEATWAAYTRPYFSLHTLELRNLPTWWKAEVDFGPDGKVQRRIFLYGRFHFAPGRNDEFKRELPRWRDSAEFRDLSRDIVTVKQFGPYQAIDCSRRKREVALWMATEMIYMLAAAARIGPATVGQPA